LEAVSDTNGTGIPIAADARKTKEIDAMTRTTLAVAADYADALLVARRSKNVLFLLLLLVLLLQITVFCLYHFDVFHNATTTTASAAVSVTPAAPAADGQPAPAHRFEVTLALYRWVINATTFLGMTLVIVLAVVLLLTSVIMLVGRLIGVSHLTSAFVWCVFLVVLLFPWQSLLNSNSGTYEAMPSLASPSEAYTSPARPDQQLPGVLTTWTEIERASRFESKPVTPEVVLHWMRFVGWPVVAIVLLMIVQSKGSRGLRFALGESDIPVEVNPIQGQ
jgi:hypothetical protein